MMQTRWVWLALLTALVAVGGLWACGDDDDDNDDNDNADDDNDDTDDDNDDTADDDAADDDTGDDDTGDDDTDVTCETVVIGPLEWAQCDNGENINHYDALAYAESLELGGHDDWRLPTRAELLSLYDEGVVQDTECFLPAHIVEPFHLTCSWVWTGEISPVMEEIAWDVGFTHGTVTIEYRESVENLRALAVRDLPD